jgi:thioredoxin-related protein
MKNLLLIIFITNLYSCAFRNREKNLLPSFNLLLMDSVTVFNTSQIPEGKPIVLMYFSPDCEHCQVETEEILNHMSALKNVRFYYITYDPIDRLKVFNHHYRLEKYSNILLSRDYTFSLSKYFKISATPYLAIFNKNKQLSAVFSGGAEVSEIIKVITDVK